MNLRISPGTLAGSVSIPSSKSHTIRALVIAALADGVSQIHQPLDSSDTASCVSVLRDLGVQIDETRAESGRLSDLRVVGRNGIFVDPGCELDCGNSGTTFYLMLSAAALANFPVRLTGDAQLQQRPAGPLLCALEELGVTVERNGVGECAPLTVTGPLRGGLATMECPTSQYLTSLLLSTPLAPVDCELAIPFLNEKPYVEMTMAWLTAAGISYQKIDWSAFMVRGRQHYHGFERTIAADFSAATFFLAAAAITGSTLDLTGLDMKDSQGDREVVAILRDLGCGVSPSSNGIRIAGPASGGLSGGTVDLNDMPDALPALAVVGTACSEPLWLTNVPQAREKETDRIAVMATELSSLGAKVEERPDGLIVHPSILHGGRVSSHGDHRVAMALAVAALRATEPVTVVDAEVARITYPGFFESLRGCGAEVVAE